MTLTPTTIVRAVAYEGSLDDILSSGRRTFIALGNSGPPRRFFYSAEPSPHCVMVVRNDKSYADRWLDGRSTSLEVTGYDADLVASVAEEITRSSGLPFQDSLPSGIVRFMQASMRESFPLIVSDPTTFIEKQRTK